MSDPAALRPCPFCGGDARIMVGHHTQYIACNGCDILGPNLEDKSELIAAWNQRDPAAIVPDPLNEAMVEIMCVAAWKVRNPYRAWDDNTETGPYEFEKEINRQEMRDALTALAKLGAGT